VHCDVDAGQLTSSFSPPMKRSRPGVIADDNDMQVCYSLLDKYYKLNF